MIVFALLAAVTAAALWHGVSGVFTAPQLQRSNYRGHELPVAAGTVIVLAVLAITAAAHVVAAFIGADWSRELASLDLALLVALGFGLLGFLDDMLGDASRRGFSGHLGAALRGEFTTGFVKLAGGVAIGVVVAGAGGPSVGDDGLAVIRAGLVIAATANLGNLFDRAPGRVVKMAMVGIVVVLALGGLSDDLVGPVVVVAAGVGLLVPDLRERCMLGDTGSNVLGAAVGLGLVSSLDHGGEWVALGVVVVANAVSERVSFSEVIDRVAPLRWLDRLGSMR
jgi:UDP-GlcNAc:undecaprenyl-phosphate/decaprenyl-phosphate GlcNAc-1-phosphate transferase